MSTIRVGVLRGGPSSEYEVSLKSGAEVLSNLPEQYSGRDILIDKWGAWHMDGREQSIDRILNQVDVIFNAMHGEYGEDGQVQQILDTHSVPYTGTKAMGSALAMNKVLTKQTFEKVGIKTPYYKVLRAADDIHDQIFHIFRTFPLPAIIKPIGAGSSVGVTIVRDYNGLERAVHEVLSRWPEVLIEELITGKELTCGVLENFRDENLYTMLPVEIIPPEKSEFFSADVKYTGETQELCPARISEKESREIQEAARIAHEAVHARHYSRTDFILSPRGLYALEINTHPGLTSESLLPKPLKAIGCEFPQFLDHVIQEAMSS
ncbi:D-alanine--D-alanine ligase [Candidatus Wolfebacteria bacterium]|nr:MAG: D-alanine--D-alanine ligase [Candidatus Wolfebacteria bacterium]